MISRSSSEYLSNNGVAFLVLSPIFLMTSVALYYAFGTVAIYKYTTGLTDCGCFK